MVPVNPHSRTTLVLDRSYQPYAFFTARAAVRHMINKRVKGIDSAGNAVSWDGSDIDEYPGRESTYSWLTGVNLHNDQPCLRSAPNGETGEETQWPVPTIVVCTHHFGFHSKRGQFTSLRAIYNVYKGICQYCLQKIPFTIATKDHVYPTSKGGTNDHFNLVLACRDCNSAKDNIFPYFDVNGKEVSSRSIPKYGVQVPEDMGVREEWRPYLYMH
jgi:hypothetical protein